MDMRYTIARVEGEEEIEYSLLLDVRQISKGCPAHYGSLNYPGHPGEEAEYEIDSVSFEGKPFVLTAVEEETIYQWIVENWEEDY